MQEELTVIMSMILILDQSIERKQAKLARVAPDYHDALHEGIASAQKQRQRLLSKAWAIMRKPVRLHV